MDGYVYDEGKEGEKDREAQARKANLIKGFMDSNQQEERAYGARKRP